MGYQSISQPTYRKKAKQIADVVKPMHVKTNDPCPPMEHITERSRAVPITNAQLRQLDRILMNIISNHSIWVHYEEDFKRRK